jgi:hypothetical protein
MLKQHFTLVFVWLNTLEMFPQFVQHVIKCHSSLHHIKENHSLTVPEHHDHHVAADGEHQGAALFLFLSPSLFCPAT